MHEFLYVTAGAALDSPKVQNVSEVISGVLKASATNLCEGAAAVRSESDIVGKACSLE